MGWDVKRTSQYAGSGQTFTAKPPSTIRRAYLPFRIIGKTGDDLHICTLCRQPGTHLTGVSSDAGAFRRVIDANDQYAGSGDHSGCCHDFFDILQGSKDIRPSPNKKGPFLAGLFMLFSLETRRLTRSDHGLGDYDLGERLLERLYSRANATIHDSYNA